MTLRLGRILSLDLFPGGKCYVCERRLHHFWVGVGLVGAGVLVARHDRHDYPWAFSRLPS
jgi:hypothetical protein